MSYRDCHETQVMSQNMILESQLRCHLHLKETQFGSTAIAESTNKPKFPNFSLTSTITSRPRGQEQRKQCLQYVQHGRHQVFYNKHGRERECTLLKTVHSGHTLGLACVSIISSNFHWLCIGNQKRHLMLALQASSFKLDKVSLF